MKENNILKSVNELLGLEDLDKRGEFFYENKLFLKDSSDYKLSEKLFYFVIASFTIFLFLLNLSGSLFFFFDSFYTSAVIAILSLFLGIVFIYYIEYYNFKDHPMRHLSAFVIVSIDLSMLFVILSLLFSFVPLLRQMFFKMFLLYVISAVAFIVPYFFLAFFYYLD
ncbi:MAG: hypothetical protein GWP09_02990, partial [Nitrospiraceae bacterium]|nr:hypothetical protein [Nitrospiraceae bacterium]